MKQGPTNNKRVKPPRAPSEAAVDATPVQVVSRGMSFWFLLLAIGLAGLFVLSLYFGLFVVASTFGSILLVSITLYVFFDIAEDIGMHESTVSRVTTHKYVQTPHGIYELKYFFNSSIGTSDGASIASESVKEKIRAIISHEDSAKPLSDQRIAEILHASSIYIARRTVTKYREAMRILSSTRRKQFR